MRFALGRASPPSMRPSLSRPRPPTTTTTAPSAARTEAAKGLAATGPAVLKPAGASRPPAYTSVLPAGRGQLRTPAQHGRPSSRGATAGAFKMKMAGARDRRRDRPACTHAAARASSPSASRARPRPRIGPPSRQARPAAEPTLAADRVFHGAILRRRPPPRRTHTRPSGRLAGIRCARPERRRRARVSPEPRPPPGLPPPLLPRANWACGPDRCIRLVSADGIEWPGRASCRRAQSSGRADG